MKKICVITGSRAEYGLLRWVIQGILESHKLKLQLIASGTHLSPEFGLTVKDIEADGLMVDSRIEMLLSSDTSVGVCKSMGLGIIGFSDAMFDLKPDLLLVLGDRYEIFAAAAAANISLIPIAHLHGGETTEGAFDEAMRHSITKMSHLHFVAEEKYRQRVIQLGEHPSRVFLVGGLGVDSIKHSILLSLKELEASLDFKLGSKSLLITFHPVTFEASAAAEQLSQLLDALAELRDTQLIFTMPNADTESRALIKLIEEYVAQHSNARAFTALGQLHYLSCIAHVDGVVGNSSSGLLEVPSFKKGTINIGDRQRGRLQASSVINCDPIKKSINDAINKLYSKDFQEGLNYVLNPYGEGGASEKIVKTIKFFDIDRLAKKSFFDLSTSLR